MTISFQPVPDPANQQLIPVTPVFKPVKGIVLKCIPVAGFVFQFMDEKTCCRQIEDAAGRKDKIKVTEWIQHKNQTKKHSLVGLAIHALLFAASAFVFPLAGAFLATTYGFLVFKNIVNIQANEKTAKEIGVSLELLAPGQKCSDPRMKPFSLSNIE